jgi:hypothetical protein
MVMQKLTKKSKAVFRIKLGKETKKLKEIINKIINMITMVKIRRCRQQEEIILMKQEAKMMRRLKRDLKSFQ